MIDEKALEIAAEVVHLEDAHAIATRVIEAYEAAKQKDPKALRTKRKLTLSKMRKKP